MADWGDFGTLLIDGFQETPESGVLRTPMDDGFTQQQQVYSRTQRRRPVRYYMSAAQYQAFIDWFGDTLNGGARSFNWTDPRLAVSVVVRIVKAEYDAVPETTTLAHWFVSMTFEGWD